MDIKQSGFQQGIVLALMHHSIITYLPAITMVAVNMTLDNSTPAIGPLPRQAAAFILLAFVLKTLYRLITVRMMFRRLRAQGYVGSPIPLDHGFVLIPCSL